MPWAKFFVEVVNPALAVIFETTRQAIYNYLDLDLVDEIAMWIINGGMANRYQLITSLSGDVSGRFQNAFRSVARWIDDIRDGLDTLGALDFTEGIVGLDHFTEQSGGPSGRSKTVATINEEPQEEYIKITDGKGNTGYLSSDKLNITQNSDGLEDLVNVLRESRMTSMLERLKNSINPLQEFLNNNTLNNAMDPIKDELANIFRNTRSAFQFFLIRQTDWAPSSSS